MLVEPIGRNIDPEFRPELTSAEMLRLGVFGGSYMSDCENEFPRGWFKGAKPATDAADRSLNYFLVNASQPLSEWRRKCWIYPADPRGWFQWYCRYYMGVRLPNEDARQIKRRKAVDAMFVRRRSTASPATSPPAGASGSSCITHTTVASRSRKCDFPIGARCARSEGATRIVQALGFPSTFLENAFLAGYTSILVFLNAYSSNE